MAKRANPFIEDFVPQSKIHVGMKQFNNNEDRLKKVYEKTLQLLFKGAKKCAVQDIANTDAVPHNRKDGLKQLCIGKDGALLHTALVESEKTLPVQHCSCGSSTVESQCAYCECNLCSSCQHGCLRCDRLHCQRCSFVGSEGSEVCVSCYG